MRISEITNEKALDTLADVMTPLTEILSDTAVKERFAESKIEVAKYLCKHHQKPVIEIFAYLDGEEPKNYKLTIPKLLTKILEILNDPEISDFFTSQVTETE